ncbi:hypothetical protein J4H86_24225 [Spiractinospora alimapuensis]|uniref:hypothetical protein n=1 Tax=Spiractinospora alimapuensis TaxID=2820884 RepID=UPI001F424E3E|nr:hypothetical protein [Spiractinospora alimapuensis]QVQ51835.1 hypothetical protein J4H86_24225 [Spiractinospora alimapuensis]
MASSTAHPAARPAPHDASLPRSTVVAVAPWAHWLRRGGAHRPRGGPAREGGDDMQVLELQALEVPTEEAAIPSSASIKLCG